jgi:hypothetical protein
VDKAELQVPSAAKSGELIPLIATPEICKTPPPKFLSVMSFGALNVPLGVLEKLSAEGETDSLGAVCAKAELGNIKATKLSTRLRTCNIKGLSMNFGAPSNQSFR